MSPASPRSRLLRRARGVVSLLVLGAASMPLIGWSNAVEVIVDGEVLSARTYAATVGELLDQLEVAVGPADEVRPAPHAALGDGTTVDIDRAITVDVAVDGAVVRRISAPVASVAGVLAEADLDVRALGGTTTPDLRSPVADGDLVHVRLPDTVRLTVDGTSREVATLTTTVGAMLAEQGIELGPDDVVDWDLEARLQRHTNVTVERVAYDEVVEEVVLEHDEVERETDDLLEGETRVETEGRDGLREDTYRVERVDGEEVGRELVDREVVREPQDRVVLVGTAAPAPPPPPPPPPPPAATPRVDPAPSSSGDDVWDRLARCESGGNWAARGTYHGGLQFHPDTWSVHKPSGAPTYAYEASRDQQIAAGRSVQRSQGWNAWPHCAAELGLA